jgi:hypothetical protein
MSLKVHIMIKSLKVWWHAALFFVYFIFFLHYMLVSNGYTVYDAAGGQWWWVMTCNGDLRGIGGFQDVVLANLLGFDGVQVTVSSKIDPFPHGTRTLQPTHQRLKWLSICMATSVS